MKVYISADIEGITGVSHWDETNKTKGDYPYFAQQMTSEVRSACIGANEGGAEEVWIKDAHGSARNISILDLPENVKITRGWSRHPFLMMQELDSSFNAAMMVGYHSCSGSGDNPLAHTLDDTIAYIKINDIYASEFLINAYTAALVDVPVVFVSGDEGLCNHVKQINKNITTLAVKKGSGNSTTSIHPVLASKLTTENVQSALKGDLSKCRITLPKNFKVEISYVNHYNAYRASFYPGMKQVSPTNVVFETDDYFQVLCAFSFVI